MRLAFCIQNICVREKRARNDSNVCLGRGSDRVKSRHRVRIKAARISEKKMKQVQAENGWVLRCSLCKEYNTGDESSGPARSKRCTCAVFRRSIRCAVGNSPPFWTRLIYIVPLVLYVQALHCFVVCGRARSCPAVLRRGSTSSRPSLLLTEKFKSANKSRGRMPKVGRSFHYAILRGQKTL